MTGGFELRDLNPLFFCLCHHANYNKLRKTLENDKILMYNSNWLIMRIWNM